MTEPRLNHFLSLGPHGFHRVAYTEWGDPAGQHIVVCVHGLTRNSRDFDELAEYLAVRGCRVVCMDVVGRGDSDWFEHKGDYGFAQYLSDAAALLARVTAAPHRISLLRRLQGASVGQRIDWVGTSMGGLIGMMLAARSGSPIRRLVLNDVGPLISWSALVRLKLASTGAGARFASLKDVEEHLREACASFGPLKDEQWRRLAAHGSRLGKDGAYRLAYDPAIMTARSGSNAGVEFGSDFMFGIDLWQTWDAIECPTLVLRGAESELLPESTARRMQERGPRVKLAQFTGIGHAPWLMSIDQIEMVADFILAAERRTA
ncbi:MAG TPA: alpha/beta hydrolase [Burkholderiales bacterium]|nr:alpha/beta hydrolase [Burkholderiales bacterium]